MAFKLLNGLFPQGGRDLEDELGETNLRGFKKNELTELQPITILRSRFAYRINCEVPIGERRIQDLLENMTEYDFLHIENIVIERWNQEKAAYERTQRSLEEGPLLHSLFQIGRTDALYPHIQATDTAMAAIAKEHFQEIGVRFPMANLYNHVFGKLLIPTGDEEETERELSMRVGTMLGTRNFIAFTNAYNDDLSNKLGLRYGEEINAVIIPKWKIPFLTVEKY